MLPFRFDPFTLPAEAEALRGEVRAFLAEALAEISPSERALSWSGANPAFSRKVGTKGWIGMTWPKVYGGGERSSFERFVVLEEMLAAGAPVGAHWVADRQSGPMLLRYGTEAQRREILPRIVKGECFFCIGMSEPDSGSDLASVRTKAQRVDGGYRVTGRKLWTSYAHAAHMMIGLFRTHSDPENRHAGLSQFLVDLKSPGITIRPIRNLAGEGHFNEVIFDDVFLAEDLRIGQEGDGWKQVTAELAFERSGPDRFMSSYRLIVALLDEVGAGASDEEAETLGRLVASLGTFRQMSVALAGMLNSGLDPSLEASVLKDIGTSFEQAVPQIAYTLRPPGPAGTTNSDYREVLETVVQAAPSFSLRGGTREIMRGMIARGLGLR